jgi:transposase
VREARPDDHAAVLKVWPERRPDLASSRTQVVCRLHAVLSELVPGGVAKKIVAAHAARLLEAGHAAGRGRGRPLRARRGAHRGPAPHRRPAARDQAKPGTAVRASGTSLTSVFGVGPVIAATIIGEVRDVSRFRNRDHFASCNGTAPIEVSSAAARAAG